MRAAKGFCQPSRNLWIVIVIRAFWFPEFSAPVATLLLYHLLSFKFSMMKSFCGLDVNQSGNIFIKMQSFKMTYVCAAAHG
jgi:hypothetical protein